MLSTMLHKIRRRAVGLGKYFLRIFALKHYNPDNITVFFKGILHASKSCKMRLIIHG